MTWTILFKRFVEPRFIWNSGSSDTEPALAGQAATADHATSVSPPAPALDLSLDPLAFAREAFGFEPFPKQAEVLNPAARRGILLCSRQWGKSTVLGARAAHMAITKPGSLTLIVAPIGPQANETLVKAVRFIEKVGIRTRKVAGYVHSAQLPNGSRILARAGQPQHIRGISAVDLLILDEAAFLHNDVYPAVLPMISTTKGELWLASTPHGRRGFFYKEFTSNDPGWTRIMSTADDSPFISKEEIDRQRKLKGKNWILQEYFCKWADPDDAFFDMADLEKCYDDSIEPLFPNGY